MKWFKQLSITAALWGLTLMAQAADISSVQQRWAEIRYSLPASQQASAFEQLSSASAQLTEAEPDNAAVQIWHGIVLSSWAGAAGGLGALSKVKEAKRHLEQAIALDPQALQGSAYTSLGALYYQVPGWPIGFGDNARAEQLLQQALQIDPDGIDANFFWADYLAGQKRYAEARAALLRARAAAPRPGRELADQGRQGEIQALLDRL
ncbi:MAG: hypothetical protein CVV07_09225 [Gammaproteobacteria bacterium HGW-Gammaproteobacteria-11]|nr:MAG: hypothetical protein CVV07_09225 [Gammaproteobacteria bacterium HGW-Gammaproteobacteria-11]